MDHVRVKAAQREFYEAGEYFALSDCLLPAAEALVARSGIGPGDRVLDVGCGDGSVARCAAARGASVVGGDVSVVQLHRARARESEWRQPGVGSQGHGVGWVGADAESLPFADASFDAVLSSFGAVISTRPEQMLSELVRVVRPGGVLGLTAWPPSSLIGEVNAAVRAASRNPDGFVDQDLGWGVEAVARGRFEGLLTGVAFAIDAFPFDRQARAAAGSADFAAQYVTTFDVLADGASLGAVQQEIRAAHTDSDGVCWAEYAVVIGRRPPAQT